MRVGWSKRLSCELARPASLIVLAPLVATHDRISWWAVSLTILVVVVPLVLAACWMAKYTDAAEVQTPLMSWKRHTAEKEASNHASATEKLKGQRHPSGS